MNESKTVDRRTRRTVRAIKQAFFELASEKGIEKVTVSDIAERADINRKTFYHHYSSIEALFDEVLFDEARYAAASIRDGVLDESGELDVMKLFQTLSIKITEMAERNGAMLANVDTERFIRYFEPIMMQVASERIPDVYGDVPDEQMRYLITFIYSGLISVYHRWLADNSNYDMGELAELLSVLIATGLTGFKDYIDASPRK